MWLLVILYCPYLQDPPRLTTETEGTGREDLTPNVCIQYIIVSFVILLITARVRVEVSVLRYVVGPLIMIQRYRLYPTKIYFFIWIICRTFVLTYKSGGGILPLKKSEVGCLHPPTYLYEQATSD